MAGTPRSRRFGLHAALLAGTATAACGSDTRTGSTTPDSPDATTATGGASGGAGASPTGGVPGGGAGGLSAGGTAGQGSGGRAMGGTAGQGSGGQAAGGAAGSGGQTTTGHACMGHTNPNAQLLCRTQADCPPSSAGAIPGGCVLEVPPMRGCGNPNFLPHQCDVDSDCPIPGSRCQVGTCGETTCIEPCTAENCSGVNYCVDNVCVAKPCDVDGGTVCPDGFTCGAAGSCEAVSCTDGFECEAFQECDPASAAPHGCVAAKCTQDADCACGYCVNQNCAPTLGFCYEILATPYGCVWPDEELV